ncbi:EpsG family protein [uncultured Lactobacillus sp.]|uniref:EpsG family protein n=1 Tax=uncultured Lactobacillus sp. TaxID=153152 RepID=UPI00258B3CD6|nr:EpsG family protein [uncultured Lactobacillus sp.]
MNTINNSAIYFRIGITMLLCLMGVIFQKNKIISYFQMVWIVILTCFNTQSADWLANFDIYQSSYQYNGFFGWLMDTAINKLNFNFYLFNGILSFCSLLIIFFIILRIAIKPNFVLSLWMIFPLIDNIVQKRYFWAFGIVTLALYLLFYMRNKKLSFIYYELLILLANSIHNSYVVFFVLPIFLWLSRKQQIIITSIVICLGIILRSRLLFVANGLLTGLDSKTTLYLGNVSHSPFLAILIWGIWQFTQCLIVYILYRKQDIDYRNIFIATNIFFLMLIPLYAFDPVFMRCFRPMLVFNYILISNKLVIVKKSGSNLINKKVFISSIIYVMLIILTFYMFDCSSRTSLGFDQMVKTIYANNSLLN